MTQQINLILDDEEYVALKMQLVPDKTEKFYIDSLRKYRNVLLLKHDISVFKKEHQLWQARGKSRTLRLTKCGWSIANQARAKLNMPPLEWKITVGFR